MPLLVNLHHLEDKNLRLQGKLRPNELEIESLDELVHIRDPLSYDLEAQKLERGILVQGSLKLTLECDCARCLKSHSHAITLEPWVCHLALEGEEKVAVTDDCVDLTPYLREDILLAFPQHPLCEPECKGLASPQRGLEAEGSKQSEPTSSAWAELNKLEF